MCSQKLLARIRLPLLLLPLLLCARPSWGQQVSVQTAQGQIERARLPNPSLPLAPSALSEGQPADGGDTQNSLAPASSGDSDLGVQSLLRAPKLEEPFTFFADGGAIYTSNVALTRRDTQDDVFGVVEAGVGYDHKFTPELALSAAVREQYFAYDRFSSLDFGALNFAVGASYVVHPLSDAVISAQLGFTRLTHRGLFDNEFFRSGNLELGLQKLFALDRAQLLTVGGDLNLGVAFPHVAEREEFGLSAGYVLQLSRHFSIQTGGRVAYFLYADTGRADFNAAGSVGLTYAFTSWASVGATVSGTVDRSSRSVFDYDVLNTGASVFLRLKF